MVRKLRKYYLTFAALIAAAFVIPLLGMFIYLNSFAPLPEVVVPNVLGVSLQQAAEIVQADQLRLRQEGEVADLNFPAGAVARQLPEPGRQVKAGRLIKVWISSGPRKVKVPNLLGRSIDQVETVLRASGLILGSVQTEYSREPAGQVLAQEPLPDVELETGSPIAVTVATSLEPLAVPGPDKTKSKQGGFWLW